MTTEIFTPKEPDAIERYRNFYLLEDRNLLVPDTMSGLANPIKRRMILHEYGFCSMFTAVAMPGVDISLDMVPEMMERAVGVNDSIGLPHVGSGLIIRTRPYETRAGDRHGFNPFLIIEKKPNGEFRYRSNSAEGWDDENDPEKWFEKNKYRYRLIHEENSELQTRSVHGRLMSANHDRTHELFVGMGVEHMRDVGKSGIWVVLKGHELGFMVDSAIRSKYTGSIDDFSSVGDIYRLMKMVSPHQDELLIALNKLTERESGHNVVLEFRIYPCGPGLQIYDFDGGRSIYTNPIYK